MAPDVLPPLTPLEIVAGWAWTGEVKRQLPATPYGLTPVRALEEVLRTALEDPPCLVSFSGGRDSSALLAVAATLARREGLPDPIPATIRSASAENDEGQWQELVVRRLALRDWHRLSVVDELEILGEVATAALSRRGVVYPFNAHFVPYCVQGTRARSLVVGVDGDGLLGEYLWQPLAELLGGHRVPTRMDFERLALACAPRRVRQEWAVRRLSHPRPWLRQHAWRRFNNEVQRYAFSEPVTWPRRVAWYATYPAVARTIEALEIELEYEGVRLCAPFWDERFLSAVATDGGVLGYGTRTSAMRRIFGDLLPDEVLRRRTKASFDELFWGPRTTEFARNWNGTGLDSSLVDPAVLKACWEGGQWPGASGLAIQQAWSAARP